jgi:hypothetical protein
MRGNTEEARRKYQPVGRIKILFVAEAPPADPERFFYFHHVRSHDWLYLGLMRALYPDLRELPVADLRRRKALYLQRFQGDGYYLVDACNHPMPQRLTRAGKQQVLISSLPNLIERVHGLVDAGTPVILISSRVHAVCYHPLSLAGMNVSNAAAIDFPSSGRQQAFHRKLVSTLRSLSAPQEPPSWSKADDGTILDENQRVAFFSCQRFVESICMGSCCFICGAVPGEKEFNDEHVLPKWLLREFGLFDRTIALPNGSQFQYGRYKIACCAECNSLMGKLVETPVRELLHRGYGAVSEHLTTNGGLMLFVWMALIFLKTHLRDRNFNLTLDRRASQLPIASLYEWDSLHHVHTIARCFFTGAEVQREVFGTLFVLPARIQERVEPFDVADLYEAQTILLRCHDVAIVTVFNDSTAVTGHLRRVLEKVSGPLSPLQLREIMVEAACCNLHLKERPQYASLVDLRARTNKIVAALPEKSEWHSVDLKIRGKLMEHSLRTHPGSSFVGYRSTEEFLVKVREGLQTFLYDDDGNFIANQIEQPVK